MDIRIIAQIGYSQTETWAARMFGDAQAARLEDIPSLPKSGWMPVGTVEFCRTAMAQQGVPEPEPLDYPDALRAWMPYGGPSLGVYSELPKGWTYENHQGVHGKPVVTKLGESLWEPDTPFWSSPYHRFGPEYRFYVLRGEILGYGRYDDREDDPNDPLPLDIGVVREMLDAYQRAGAPVGYSLDVGVSDEDGQTKLVEVNDGWALGFYTGSCQPRAYLRLLEARWLELAKARPGG